MNDLRLSVVVPTFRRPDLLQRCLQALGAQTISPDWFEVVVVDDANDADTAALVQQLAHQLAVPVRYLGQPRRRGPAAARNRGWLAAQAPIIAFTDDDCVPQPGWLAAALERFDKGASVVTGRVIMPLPDKATAHDRTAALLETAEFVTANCFCRRTALEQVAGFDETFDIAWREDSALHFALLRAGLPVEYCPEAALVHPLRPAPWYAPLTDERKNRYDALLYKRYPDLFRARIPQYRALVTTYYGIVGSALLGLGGIFTGKKKLVRTSGISWLVLTAGLLLRRQAGQPLRALPKNGLIAALSPFLSVYWRLYGAVKYRVWYW